MEEKTKMVFSRSNAPPFLRMENGDMMWESSKEVLECVVCVVLFLKSC